jgi:hypothetical protein
MLKSVPANTSSFGKNRSKRGFGTVEIVLIIAVLISLALLFRSSITSYAQNLMDSVFSDNDDAYGTSEESRE